MIGLTRLTIFLSKSKACFSFGLSLRWVIDNTNVFDGRDMVVVVDSKEP